MDVPGEPDLPALLMARRRRVLNIALLALGMLLLLVAVVDALWTTLWVDGSAGPLASRVTTWSWHGVLRLNGRRRHHALSLFGPGVLVSIVVMWVVLIWAGWVFLFAAEPGSLWHARDERWADWSGRIFYVAQAMFTMGNGDFTPVGDAWQIASSLTTASGMLTITLVISYLLSVLGAVVAKRAFASQVAGLGGTAEEFLQNAWDGQDFRPLDLPLSALSTALAGLTEQYLSYPILQYYHGARPEKSPIVGLVVLDEALTLLRYGVPENRRPNPAVLHGARRGVRSFLDTLERAFIEPSEDVPPPPDLGKLREAGIPTVGDEEFARALGELEERRRKLLGLLRNDGWNWSDRST